MLGLRQEFLVWVLVCTSRLERLEQLFRFGDDGLGQLRAYSVRLRVAFANG